MREGKKLAENSTAERKRGRGPGRPFQKGQSGNPGGRPREEREVVEALRKKGLELVDALLKLALRKKNPNVKAIEIAFERAYGKARTLVELSGRDGEPIAFDLTRLTDEQLDQFERLHEIVTGGGDAPAEPH